MLLITRTTGFAFLLIKLVTVNIEDGRTKERDSFEELSQYCLKNCELAVSLGAATTRKIFVLQRFVIIIIGEHEVKQGFSRETRRESLLAVRTPLFSLVFTLKILYRIIRRGGLRMTSFQSAFLARSFNFDTRGNIAYIVDTSRKIWWRLKSISVKKTAENSIVFVS